MYILRILSDAPLPAGVPPTVPIGPQVTILVGRRLPQQDTPDARIVSLEDGTVTAGRHGHCRIWQVGDDVLLADCGSDNGTWLLGGSAERSAGTPMAPSRIQAGQLFRAGRRMLRLELAESG